MVYHGTFQNGVVVFKGRPALAEGTSVRVQPVKARGTGVGQRLMKFAGKAKGLPRDMARNHDHYLHGQRKK